MRRRVTRILKELKEALRKIYGPNLCAVYLYGSYATRKEDAESDVDVVIVLKDFRDYWEEVQRTSQIVSQLSLKYDLTISPVRVREADWRTGQSPFLGVVRREGVPV